MRGAGAIIGMGLAVLASPAVACSIVPFVPGTTEAVGACGHYSYVNEATALGVSDAEDLGKGFVAQYFFSGNACYGQTSMIVSDCASGRAVVFGPGPVEGPMEPASPSGLWKQIEAQVRGAAEAGRPMMLAELLARASGAGFINAAEVAIPGRYGISNDTAAPVVDFNLGCGCGVFYPGSPGAGK